MSSMGGDAEKVEPSALEIELANRASKEWADWKRLYVPLENELIQRVEDFRSSTERRKAKGYAAASAQQATGRAEDPAPASGGPKSGGYYAYLRDRNLARAKGLTAGINQTHFGTEARHLTGKADLIRVGRNVQAQASANLSDAAANEQASRIAAAQADQAKSDALWSGIGTMAGMAAPYLKGLTVPASQTALVAGSPTATQFFATPAGGYT
jgi:hypothetical protein